MYLSLWFRKLYRKPAFCSIEPFLIAHSLEISWKAWKLPSPKKKNYTTRRNFSFTWAIPASSGEVFTYFCHPHRAPGLFMTVKSFLLFHSCIFNSFLVSTWYVHTFSTYFSLFELFLPTTEFLLRLCLLFICLFLAVGFAVFEKN